MHAFPYLSILVIYVSSHWIGHISAHLLCGHKIMEVTRYTSRSLVVMPVRALAVMTVRALAVMPVRALAVMPVRALAVMPVRALAVMPVRALIVAGWVGRRRTRGLLGFWATSNRRISHLKM